MWLILNWFQYYGAKTDFGAFRKYSNINFKGFHAFELLYLNSVVSRGRCLGGFKKGHAVYIIWVSIMFSQNLLNFIIFRFRCCLLLPFSFLFFSMFWRNHKMHLTYLIIVLNCFVKIAFGSFGKSSNISNLQILKLSILF